MTGTPSQIEWAELIKPRVGAEFDRVARALRETVQGPQTGPEGEMVQAVIAIIEEKRAEVMARDEAGYFIRYWQELSDQVREMVTRDPRYQALKAQRQAPLG